MTDTESRLAIIGLTCRFPGSPDPAALWSALRGGVESIARFSVETLRAASVAPELATDPDYVPCRGRVAGLEGFDAGFFALSPREAGLMDPQHRVFLESAWHALEAAGVDPARFDGLIGVYAGSGYGGHPRAPRSPVDDLEAAIGAAKDHLALRVSHKLDLQGPSLSVQTACSTSLVAVHLACQALLSGECDLALAGGVTAALPQESGYLYRRDGILSPDGHCRAFDAAASGTVPGNGVGVVVLRRLADALAAGDDVQAVILGSAINNDGGDKVAYTAPAVAGQARVIAEALAVASVEPETIDYVEAHGTGTALGDPVEIAALTEAFATSRRGFCAVGSVKTNLGHLDAAAGVAGLIKTVLALRHGEIPPSLHCRRPNPRIDWAASPFVVNAELRPWPRREVPRRAGVSAFGIGGTNAHVVLEEAPRHESSPSPRQLQLVLLSARSDAALERSGAALAGRLDRGGVDLADAAFTLAMGRRVLAHRRAVVAGDAADAAQALRLAEQRRTAPEAATDRPVAFIFPGQGAQRVDMGRDLFEREPIFRRQVERCCELLRPEVGLDLAAELYPDTEHRPAAAERLRSTRLAQPALFVVCYSLAQLWMAAGVKPAALLGHSLGELVAACLAGVLRLPDALRLVALRGRLAQELAPGAMLSVPSSSAELRRRLAGEEWRETALAAINGPRECTVSGPPPAIAALRQELAADGIPCRPLAVSHAFHSAAVEPILDGFRKALLEIELRPPTLPFPANVTGQWIRPQEATDAEYWVRHLRQPVRFADGVARLMEDPRTVFLEVGPGQTASQLVRRQVEHPGRVIGTLPNDGRPALESWLDALGRLWRAGAEVDWRAFWGSERRRKVALPGHPFERRRFDAASAASPAPARSNDVGAWTWIPGWRQAPPASLLETADEAAADRIFVADRQGLGARLAPGRRLSFAAADDGEALLAEVSALGVVPGSIVHLGELGPPTAACAAASLILLAGAWGRRYPGRPLRLTVVTSGVCRVLGDEALSPERATLLGAVPVIRQEHPRIRCRLVDVDSRELASPSLDQALVAELAAAGGEPVVALRHGRRWVPDSRQVRLDPNRGEALLREGGVVCITGGMGGLGLALAARLIRRRRMKVALVGRSPMPRVGASQAGPSGGSADATDRHLRALRAAGDEVFVARADVADRQQMAAAVERIRQHFGRIDGVLHAAGVSPERWLGDESASSIDAVLAPKVAGTRVLEAIFRHAELDFFVLFSSTSSWLGGQGFAAYAAANAFLDAFAQHHSLDRRTAVTAVNWGPWRDAGMLAAAAARSPIVRRSLAAAIRPDEGWDAFLRCLGAGVPQVIVSPTPWPGEIERSRFYESARAPLSAGADRPPVASCEEAPRSALEGRLVSLWQELLGRQRLGTSDNFLQLGGHSLIALQLLARLRRQEGVDLSLDEFFETLTIGELARAIEARSEAHGATRSRAGGAPPPEQPSAREVVEEGEI